jgi:quercetin dioxygenase-like cupin family protein
MIDANSPSELSAYALDRDAGEAVWFLGTKMVIKATGKETSGAFGLIEQVLPPNFAPPPHIHHAEDEAFYLLEGEGDFFCGETSWHAKPGTFIFFPRGIVHGFRIGQSGPARLLQLNSPAGVERMFIEVGDPVTASTAELPPPPAIERVITLAPGYRISFVGGPPEQ